MPNYSDILASLRRNGWNIDRVLEDDQIRPLLDKDYRDPERPFTIIMVLSFLSVGDVYLCNIDRTLQSPSYDFPQKGEAVAELREIEIELDAVKRTLLAYTDKHILPLWRSLIAEQKLYVNGAKAVIQKTYGKDGSPVLHDDIIVSQDLKKDFALRYLGELPEEKEKEQIACDLLSQYLFSKTQLALYQSALDLYPLYKNALLHQPENITPKEDDSVILVDTTNLKKLVKKTGKLVNNTANEYTRLANELTRTKQKSGVLYEARLCDFANLVQKNQYSAAMFDTLTTIKNREDGLRTFPYVIFDEHKLIQKLFPIVCIERPSHLVASKAEIKNLMTMAAFIGQEKEYEENLKLPNELWILDKIDEIFTFEDKKSK